MVYKSGCDYTGNWWILYENVDGWFYYGDEGKIYLRVKQGKKFPDFEGHMALIVYDSWDDLLKDWYVPRIVQAEYWWGGKPPQNFEGNTDFDIISGVNMTFHQIFIEGWNNDEKRSQLIWRG